MSAPPESAPLAWAWRRQRIWSHVADGLKRSLFRARVAALSLTIVSAILVTLAAEFVDLSSFTGKCLGWLAAVCAATVALIQALARADRVQSWMRARALSEALKAEIFPYLAGVAPYRGTDRDVLLKQRIDAMEDTAADLADRTIGVEPAPSPIPAVTDVDSYVTERVRGQIDRYYRPRSALMGGRARAFRIVGTALAVLAAVLSATAAQFAFKDWAAWLPVVTTIAAAVAAEATVQRYSGLAVEYARALEELERLLRDRPADEGSAEVDDAFVHAAEKVMSQQNEAWMARGTNAATAQPAAQP